MLENGKRLDWNVETGNLILQLAANFALPDKMGETTFSAADKSIASDEVRALYKEMRAYSPLMQAVERWTVFGPPKTPEGKDIWAEIKAESGRIGHRCVNPTFIQPIKLNEDIRSGLAWCLLVGLHPASPQVRSVANQEDVLWPLAEKLEITKDLRESIGISGSKAKPRRWKSDAEYDQKKSESTPAPAPARDEIDVK